MTAQACESAHNDCNVVVLASVRSQSSSSDEKNLSSSGGAREKRAYVTQCDSIESADSEHLALLQQDGADHVTDADENSRLLRLDDDGRDVTADSTCV